MEHDELVVFRQRLEAMKCELLSVAATAHDAAQTVVLDQSSVGRLSRMDAMQAQAIAVETQARMKQQLRNIDAALARIARGEYGECIDCGEPIASRRLGFDPSVALCIVCAGKREKRE